MNASQTTIAIAETSDEIGRCYDVMRELRPRVHTVDEFIERVQRQQTQGYVLAYLQSGDDVRSVAGYRYQEMLFHGRMLYVNDLVTHERDRSAGFGAMLFDWLVAEARRHGCQHFELDSGVQRFDAHRFYLMKRMKISSHHFSLPLNPE